MELASWLNTDNKDFPILGLDSFKTFLKVCGEFSDWALDDIGLANRANVYKIWVCWVKAADTSKVKETLERYTSMKLLLHYFNVNIVENNKIGLYIKLDWEQNAWVISYGITNNKKLFKVGEFDYGYATKLPDNEILKYVRDEIDDFNPREHLLLFKMKQDCFLFDPGYCQRTDPQIINKEVVISTYNLGQFVGDAPANGEPERLIQVFKDFVKTQSWWNAVHLVLRPRRGKYIDFVLRLK